MRDKIKLLYDKVEKDLNDYENNILKLTKRQILNNMYDIMHADNFYCQIEFLIQNYEEDDDYYCVDENVIDKMLQYKDNIVEYWVSHRYDIRHSERYNLENFDDFISVLTCVMSNLEIIG